jgi:hypothetical protein
MSDEDKSERRAMRIYGALVRLYPLDHRRQYGSLMAQLFRDQYRDTCRDGRRRVLVGFWIRTLLDLVRSVSREQLVETTNRIKGTPPGKPSLAAACIGLGALGCAARFVWPFTEFPAVPGAWAFAPVIVGQWRLSYRLLPALADRRVRVGAWAAGSILGTCCTALLLHYFAIPEGDPFAVRDAGAVILAFVPMGLGGSLLFGLNEAAWRKVPARGAS